MATRFSSAPMPSMASDVNFRLWVQFIHDTFITTGGWVDPGDTGQMNIAAAVASTVANTKIGYRIYRMDDALQASAPVFVRIDYGVGQVTGTPGIWVTIGQSTDGAGNIGDVRFNGGALATATASAQALSILAHNNYASAAPNRITLGLFITTTDRCLFLNIERTHDANGNDTAYGIILNANGLAAASARTNISRVVILAAVGQPPNDVGLQYLLPTENPGTYGADVGVGVHIPFAGVAQYPAIGVVVVRQADFAAESGFNMTMYGSSRTYQHLNSVQARHATPAAAGSADANSRMCIRYD